MLLSVFNWNAAPPKWIAATQARGPDEPLVAGFFKFYNGLQSQTSPNREIESFRMFRSRQQLATRGLGRGFGNGNI
jgi:hypothetical protein